MKALTAKQGEGQMARQIVKASDDEPIVLKAGQTEVILHAGGTFDLEEDTEELEKELLKAVRGPHVPLAESDLRVIADRVLLEHRTKCV